MSDITNFLIEYWHVVIVAMLLVVISIGFIFRFVVLVIQLSRELKKTIKAMTDIRSSLNAEVVELGEIEFVLRR